MPSGLIPLMRGWFCNWKFWSEPQPHMGGRRFYQPRGKTLGGSSSINAQVYIRGHASDYDRWASLGCNGWSYEEVLPYFRRSENYEPVCEPRDQRFHGKGGPLNIAERRHFNPLSRGLSRCRAAGRPAAHQRLQRRAAGRLRRAAQLSPQGRALQQCRRLPARRRSSGPISPSSPARMRRACCWKTGAQSVCNTAAAAAITRCARRASWCSAAAPFNSPQLLLLSGVGPREELDKHGIPQQHELPGVGRNLQDHLDLYVVTKAKTRVGFSFHPTSWPKAVLGLLLYAFFRRGYLTSNLVEAGAFVRSLPEEPVPDLQWHFGAVVNSIMRLRLGPVFRHYGYSIAINDNRPLSPATSACTAPIR